MKKDGKITGFGPGIKVQLIIGFVIPIIFLVFIGMFSYEKAKTSLISNYEEATLSSISMGSRYLDFGFKMVVSDTLSLTLDSSLADYAYGRYENDPAQGNIIYNKIQSSIMVKEASNSFMDGIQIIPKSMGKVMSTRGGADKGFYEDWKDSEEGQNVLSGNSNFAWIGKHPVIDEKTQSSEEDYAISYIGNLTNKAACVVVDISKKSIVESLEGLHLGVGSLVAFITNDGREITYYHQDENTQGNEKLQNMIFSNETFYVKGMEKEETVASEYITYQGEEYLFMYSKSEINGSTICAMVPYSSVIQGAEVIKKMTDFLVLMACIIVGILAIVISMNISVSIGRIIDRLKMVSGGDLTVQLYGKGKSEFSQLSRHIMGVVENTRKLIKKVEDTLFIAQKSTIRVSTVSDKIWESSSDISDAVKDIDGGVSEQSANLQSCAVMMSQLSDSIGTINENVLEMEKYADSTQNMIETGINTIEKLSGQSLATTEITEKVQKDIGLLVEESLSIRKFVDIIHEIASQTNLLSLNAAIEAARAGQAGRGFAVVADEVQRLADGSMEAANEIEKVITNIQMRMSETVDVAGRAKNVVDKQTQMVKQTKDVFDNISRYTKQLLNKIADVSEGARQVDEERAVTIEVINNISAASVQTAASSYVVNMTVEGQIEIAKTLKVAAAELDSNMNELIEVLAVFKI